MKFRIEVEINESDVEVEFLKLDFILRLDEIYTILDVKVEEVKDEI